MDTSAVHCVYTAPRRRIDQRFSEASADMHLSERHVYLTLQDALRRGSDKRLRAHVESVRKQGFGWRFDGLGDWPTERIFAKLNEIDIDTAPDRFRDQALRAGRRKRLVELWRGDKNWDDSPWDDFPLIAVEELWRRLTPDLVCPESVADLASQVIQEAEGAQAGRVEPDRELAAAMQVVDYLSSFPPEQRAGKYEELLDCTIHDMGLWLLQCVLDHGKEHPDEVTRLADIMSEAEPDTAANYQGDLAVALTWAGRAEDALARVQRNLETYPKDVWIRIKAGDVYAELDRTADAVTLYVEAMASAEAGYDWDGAFERLADALAKLGRDKELRSIKARHPRPKQRARFPREAVPKTPRIDFTLPDRAASRKTGRNDPCPCGSGRKYKKCCLGLD